jgi:hypothetical protein
MHTVIRDNGELYTIIVFPKRKLCFFDQFTAILDLVVVNVVTVNN